MNKPNVHTNPWLDSTTMKLPRSSTQWYTDELGSPYLHSTPQGRVKFGHPDEKILMMKRDFSDSTVEIPLTPQPLKSSNRTWHQPRGISEIPSYISPSPFSGGRTYGPKNCMCRLMLLNMGLTLLLFIALLIVIVYHGGNSCNKG
ncbi:membrane protein V1 [Felid alphaherpesvirus 1]|nr:membrane protein V1 [Felid alphaherpesvirus 1]